MVVDVPEVDRGLGRYQGAGAVGEDIERIPLGGEMPPEGQHEALNGKNVADGLLVEAGENPLFQAVHELVELVDDREIRIDRLVHYRVHQTPRAPPRELGLSTQQIRDL